MRANKDITELSYASFIETFGNINGNSVASKETTSKSESLPTSPKICVTNCDNELMQEFEANKEDDLINNNEMDRRLSLGTSSLASSNESNSDGISKTSLPGGVKKRFRKISMDKFHSLGDAVHTAVTSRRTKSAGLADHMKSIDAKKERRSSVWIANLPPYFARKLISNNEAGSSSEGRDPVKINSERGCGSNPKPAIFRIPAARLGETAHRGFLDCRNKKKQWERYWCVLQDACLYCYHSPQSEVTSDAVLLRGYEIIADVINLNRTRFIFRLQQQGVPTLHFSCDNHRDFVLWVGSLERETGTVNTDSRATFDESRMRQQRASLPNISLTPPIKARRQLNRTISQERLDQELAIMQKHKLLKEIAVQKQQILEEQKLLDKITESHTELDGSATKTSRRVSREQIMSQYEAQMMQEELKTTKHLTFLNRRRNSAHLKMVQYTKDLAPKNGHVRRDNHALFSVMEKRMKDMQDALLQIDRELEEEEANKQHNLEKLKSKRDLELLIVEQRDAMAILRRNHEKGNTQRRRHSSYSVVKSSSTHSCDTLASIDEMSCVSDDHATTSTASSSSEIVKIKCSSEYMKPHHQIASHRPAVVTRSNSDPCKRNCFSSNSSNSDTESRHQSLGKFEDTESNSSGAFNEIEISKNARAGSSHDSTLKTKSSKPIEEIDSSIMSKIEDFELFAKLKLEQNSKS